MQSENTSFADTISQKLDNAFFSDESIANFYVLSFEDGKGYVYKTVEINYITVFIIPDGYKNLEHFIAKYTTTTKACTGCEEKERNIKVDIYSFDKPSKLVHTIDLNCDKLDLKTDTYQTTVYGCCGSENIYEIFDYKNNSIIQADNQIILGDIPNSKIKLYVGFKKVYNDTILGSLNFSYNGNEKFSIKVLTNYRELRNYHVHFSPDIEILSDGHNFIKSKNEYEFWYLNRISNKNSINNLIIRLTFTDDKTGDYVIDIPIIDGKPFGKENTTQEIYVAEKNTE